MSEYQRYEFMTIDRPLTRVQFDAVNALSSHIEASSTHALARLFGCLALGRLTLSCTIRRRLPHSGR